MCTKLEDCKSLKIYRVMTDNFLGLEKIPLRTQLDHLSLINPLWYKKKRQRRWSRSLCYWSLKVLDCGMTYHVSFDMWNTELLQLSHHSSPLVYPAPPRPRGLQRTPCFRRTAGFQPVQAQSNTTECQKQIQTQCAGKNTYQGMQQKDFPMHWAVCEILTSKVELCQR